MWTNLASITDRAFAGPIRAGTQADLAAIRDLRDQIVQTVSLGGERGVAPQASPPPRGLD